LRAVNVVVAAVVGLAFWFFVAPLYTPATRALAAAAVPAMFGRGYQLGGADDVVLYTPAGLIAARVFMKYVTANLITLIALFGLAKKPLAMSNIARCAVAIACLIPIHAAAVLVVAKSFVVPPDSLWRNAAQAYTIFGCHAISFALWSLLRPSDATSASAPELKKSRRVAAKR
jgi:hypothetical protein